MNFDDESNKTSFPHNLQTKLKQIRTEISADDPNQVLLENIIDEALNAPMLSIDEEASLYQEMLHSRDDAAENARMKLIDAHFPMVVSKLWDEYRHFDMPFEKLVEAGRRALKEGSLTFKYPTSPLKTFYSHISDVISETMLDALDECGLELVNIEEIKELAEQGRNAELEKILAPLSHIEKEAIKRHYTNSIFSNYDVMPRLPSGNYIDIVESVAVRKLRRAKKS